MSINTICRLKISDYQLLADVGRKTLLESHGSSAEKSVMESYVNNNFSADECKTELSDPENIFHAIYRQGQPAGYSKIIYDAEHPEISISNVTKLERLYLLKEYYSLKLGWELFQFNVDLSKKNRQAGMWLTVWTGNNRAINFYTNNGFKVIGEGSFKLTDTHNNPTFEMFLEY